MEVQLHTPSPLAMEVQGQDAGTDHTVSWSSLQGSISRLLTLSDDSHMPSYSVAMEIYKCFIEDERSGNDSVLAFLRSYKETVESYIFLKFFPVRYHEDQMVGFCEFLTEWKAFKNFVQKLWKALDNLDRFYHRKHDLSQLHRLAMECFNEMVFEEVKQFLKSMILDQINRHREGEEIGTVHVRNAIEVFVDVYMERSDEFEKGLEAGILQSADNFYFQILDGLANTDINVTGVKERSFSMALQALERDKQLAHLCLPETSKQRLVEKADYVLQLIHAQAGLA